MLQRFARSVVQRFKVEKKKQLVEHAALIITRNLSLCSLVVSHRLRTLIHSELTIEHQRLVQQLGPPVFRVGQKVVDIKGRVGVVGIDSSINVAVANIAVSDFSKHCGVKFGATGLQYYSTHLLRLDQPNSLDSRFLPGLISSWKRGDSESLVQRNKLSIQMNMARRQAKRRANIVQACMLELAEIWGEKIPAENALKTEFERIVATTTTNTTETTRDGAHEILQSGLDLDLMEQCIEYWRSCWMDGNIHECVCCGENVTCKEMGEQYVLNRDDGHDGEGSEGEEMDGGERKEEEHKHDNHQIKHCKHGEDMCRTCLKQYFRLQMADDARQQPMDGLCCPNHSCNFSVSDASVLALLGPKEFIPLAKKMRARRISSRPNLRFCPNDGCGMDISLVGTPIVVLFKDQWHSVVVREIFKPDPSYPKGRYRVEFREEGQADVLFKLELVPECGLSEKQYAANKIQTIYSGSTASSFFFLEQDHERPLFKKTGSKFIPGEFCLYSPSSPGGGNDSVSFQIKHLFYVETAAAARTKRTLFQAGDVVYTLKKDVGSNGLPKGWIQTRTMGVPPAPAKDQLSGQSYYYNELMQHSQWRAPVVKKKWLVCTNSTSNNLTSAKDSSNRRLAALKRQEKQLRKKKKVVRGEWCEDCQEYHGDEDGDSYEEEEEEDGLAEEDDSLVVVDVHGRMFEQSELRRCFCEEEKLERNPNRPKRPPTAYLLFANDKRASFIAANPGLSNPQIMKGIAGLWVMLTDAQKAAFEPRIRKAQREYELAMKSFSNTGRRKTALDFYMEARRIKVRTQNPKASKAAQDKILQKKYANLPPERLIKYQSLAAALSPSSGYPQEHNRTLFRELHHRRSSSHSNSSDKHSPMHRMIVNGTAVIDTSVSNTCWQCRTSICIQCGSNSHGTESCDSFHEEALVAAAHDRDLMVMCPKCRLVLERTAGCDHMTCPAQSRGCGSEFCFHCLSMAPHCGQTCKKPALAKTLREKWRLERAVRQRRAYENAKSTPSGSGGDDEMALKTETKRQETKSPQCGENTSMRTPTRGGIGRSLQLVAHGKHTHTDTTLMSFNLTNGAIAMCNTSYATPLSMQLQILSLTGVPTAIAWRALSQTRYKLIVSDGVHFMNAMLATQLNSLVEDKTIKELSVLNVTESMINDDENGHKIIIVLGCTVAGTAGGKLGNPKPKEEQKEEQEGTPQPPRFTFVSSTTGFHFEPTTPGFKFNSVMSTTFGGGDEEDIDEDSLSDLDTSL